MTVTNRLEERIVLYSWMYRYYAFVELLCLPSNDPTRDTPELSYTCRPLPPRRPVQAL
jgi:hypothetical protein